MAVLFNDVIQPFVRVCDLTSDSVDMIQAGGGNASAKYDVDGKAMMLIKASGYLMSEVDEGKGYTQIDLDKIRKILEAVKNGAISIEDDATINLKTNEANSGTLRPSIETFLHALLPQRYILHVHALITLVYASSTRFQEDMAAQWEATVASPIATALLVPYEKPGIHLALAMMSGIEQYIARHGFAPDVIILQNHGLIIASEDSEAISDQLKSVEEIIKTHIGLPETFGNRYANQRLIKKAINDIVNDKRIYVRANEDLDLINYQDGRPSFPDALVFCGLEPLVVDTTSHLSFKGEFSNVLITDALKRYIERYDDFPKVVLLDSDLYFCGESIKKCLEVQDVLKIQWILRRELGTSLVPLTEEQAHTLLNWEAEKYRKNL